MSDKDSDAMLHAGLRERDAAFLAEMGITPLWTVRHAPAAGAAAAPAPDLALQAGAPAGLSPSQPASQPAPQPASESRTDEPDLGQLDWRGLNEAIARCTRCGCKEGGKAVLGEGARAAVWMVAAGATTSADEAARHPVGGAAGKLLDNMLAAVQLSREQSVYVTNLVKCRPTSANGGDRAPSLDEVAACRPFVERELALCGAGVVLTLGQVAANALLDQPLQAPLAAARGTVHRFGPAALVATLHPGELLRQGAAKAQAWDDLCLARGQGGQGDGQAADGQPG